MTMLQLAGPPAATAFRLEKLLTELRSLASAVTEVATHFEHFVHLERPLSEREDRILRALLDYGGGAAARRRRSSDRSDPLIAMEKNSPQRTQRAQRKTKSDYFFLV